MPVRATLPVPLSDVAQRGRFRMSIGLQVLPGLTASLLWVSLLHFAFDFSWSSAVWTTLFVQLWQAALIDSEDRSEFDEQP